MRRFYIAVLSIVVYVYFAVQLAFAYIQLLFPCDCLFKDEEIEKDNI
jgi:hypothetical protein